jgi:adenosylhomocysteinase
MVLHLEAKTAVLASVIQDLGAEVSITSSNPLTTQDDVAAALTRKVSHVYAWRGETEEQYYDNIRSVLKERPHILVDDGADMILMAHELGHRPIGATEETTTGMRRVRALEKEGRLLFPVIAVNDAKGKYQFDNRFGSGQSVVDGIMRATNMMVGGKDVVVVGYGWVGKGVAQRMKGMGARVTVVEADPFRALEAYFDGFMVTDMKEAACYGDLFITCTGNKGVIGEEHFKMMKDGAVLANAGHFNVEIDVDGLKRMAKKVEEVRPNVLSFTMPEGNRLFLLAEGRLVNIVAGDGHPIEIMDLSFSLQLLSVIYFARNKGLPRKVYMVPEDVDRAVVERFLELNGVKLERLTEEQERYLKSWK